MDCNHVSSRRSFLAGLAVCCIMAFLCACGGGITSPVLYPRKYVEQVEKWAQTYNLDPLLVYAFIRTESSFDPNAESAAGARGLMQMMETTFNEVCAKIAPNEGLDFSSLYDPETSIRFGCYYLRQCLDLYGGDVATAAAAYHSGMGRVSELLQNSNYSANHQTLDVFPDKQMNNYVSKITSCYAEYKRLYAER